MTITVTPKMSLLPYHLSLPHTQTPPLIPGQQRFFCLCKLFGILRISCKWNQTEYTRFLAPFTQYNCSESHPCCHMYQWLIRMGQNRYPDLVPDLMGEIQLNMRMPMGFNYIIFIRLRKCPSSFCLLREQILDFFRCFFCIYEMIMSIFLSESATLVIRLIDFFVCIKPTLHSWDKIYLVSI